MLGDDDKALDRRATVARIFRGDRDPVCCSGKGRFRVAVTKTPVADNVVSGGRARIQCRGQWTIGHLVCFERVLGSVAITGDDDGDRFALIAHPLCRQAPMRDRRFDGSGEGPCPATGVLAGQGASHPRHRHCPGCINCQDLGVGVR